MGFLVFHNPDSVTDFHTLDEKLAFLVGADHRTGLSIDIALNMNCQNAYPQPTCETNHSLDLFQIVKTIAPLMANERIVPDTHPP